MLVSQIYITWINSFSKELEIHFDDSKKRRTYHQDWNDVNNTYTYISRSEEKTIAKDLKKNMALRKNIVETQVISQPKEIINTTSHLVIDNTKKNKPTIDMSKPAVVESMTSSRDGKNFLLLENECKISLEREKAYKALIAAINSDPQLNPSDRYTLLQCIMYVEVEKNLVIIAIDRPLLIARNVSDDRLFKNLMISNLRETFNNPQLNVVFEDYVLPSMLNYYLGVRTNG